MSVVVVNPVTQPVPVTGTVAAVVGPLVISNFPSSQSVTVSNLPATQPVSGIVSVGNFPGTQAVAGSVSIANFPLTQPVSGNINVGNFPALTPVIPIGQTPLFYHSYCWSVHCSQSLVGGLVATSTEYATESLAAGQYTTTITITASAGVGSIVGSVVFGSSALLSNPTIGFSTTPLSMETLEYETIPSSLPVVPFFVDNSTAITTSEEAKGIITFSASTYMKMVLNSISNSSQALDVFVSIRMVRHS
jgi:hypothetical protein